MDNVTHPQHYNAGKIEVIEYIEDQKLSYHLGNAVKYISRAGKKDPNKEIEDLRKAQWYINRQIEILTAAKENREAIRPNAMGSQTTPAPKHIEDIKRDAAAGKPCVDTAKPTCGACGHPMSYHVIREGMDHARCDGTDCSGNLPGPCSCSAWTQEDAKQLLRFKV